METEKKKPNPLGRLRVTLAAWQIAVGVILVGLVLLYAASKIHEPAEHSSLATLVREVGAVFIVTGVLTVGWELRGRRALIDEVFEAAAISANIQQAGVLRVVDRYLEVDWARLLQSAHHLDVFFAYGRTWRASHATDLRRLVEREGTRVRAILPDPQDVDLMKQLAAKFGYAADEVREHVQDAISDFKNLATQAKPNSEVQVKLTRRFPVFTYYRVDRRCVGVLYAQAPGRVEVPTLECEQGGWLYSWFRGQFEKLWDDGSVIPEEETPTT